MNTNDKVLNILIESNENQLNDEGYSEQKKMELVDFMNNWTDAQKAEFALRLLSSLPTSQIASVTSRLAPLLHRDFIGELPVELATHILGFSDYKSLMNASLVCKKWKNLIEDQQLWKRLYINSNYYYNKEWVKAFLNDKDMDLVEDKSNWLDKKLQLEFEEGHVTGSDEDINRLVNNFGHINLNEVTTQVNLNEFNSLPNNNTNIIIDQNHLSLINNNNNNNNNTIRSVPSSPMQSQFRLPVNRSPINLNLIRQSNDINNLPGGLLSPHQSILLPSNELNYQEVLGIPSPALSTPGPYSEMQSPVIPISPMIRTDAGYDSGPLPKLGSTFNYSDYQKFKISSEHYQSNGQKKINWKYLFQQRKLIEKNWKDGSFTLKYISGHLEGIYCLQFDEFKIVSGSRDDTIRVFDINTGRCLRTYTGHQGSVLCLQFKDNLLISGSSDSTIIMWELNTGKILKRLVDHQDSVLNLKFDDKYIVSCSKDRTIKIWDIKDGTLLRTLTGHRVAVNAIQFYNDQIVSASGDRMILLWDLNTGECKKAFIGHQRGIACLQFDGKRIISGSSDKTIKVWDIETGQCLKTLTGHTALVRTLELGKNNKLISGSYDHTIKVWDLESGRMILDLPNGHQSRIFKLQFNDTTLVSCSQELSLLVWDFAHNVDKSFLF